MGRNFDDVLKGFAPERRARIEANADAKHKQYLALKELRRARNMTQVQLAEVLGIQQASVAKMEKGGDVMLSTLRRFIEAMGGKLEIVATMPGSEPVNLERIGDLAEETVRPRKAPKLAKAAEQAWGLAADAEKVKPSTRHQSRTGRVKASPVGETGLKRA